MKIIDKDGNVLFEGEQKRPSHIYMGTARRIGNSRRMRPTAQNNLLGTDIGT